MIDKIMKISKLIAIISMIFLLVILQFQNLKVKMIEKNIFNDLLKSEVSNIEEKPKEELQKYFYVCENVNEKGENKEYCKIIESEV